MDVPKFPDDFRVLHAHGGASYWHWHPDAPPDYDGTWPSGQEPPPWAGGLMISSADGPSAEWSPGEAVVVSWEYGPEAESGPWYEVVQPEENQRSWLDEAIGWVVREVNEERAVSAAVQPR